MQVRARILMAKIGLDYHDRGLMLVSRGLADAGMEVIYIDAGQRPEEVAQIAIEEDVDIIAISSMCGTHLRNMANLLNVLQEAGKGDVPVIVGGIIPKEDMPLLKDLGVAEVFGPGTSIENIVRYVKQSLL